MVNYCRTKVQITEEIMTEIIARREFSPLYIAFDIAFLVLYGCLLLRKKKYMTFLVGFLGNIIYGGGLRYFPPCMPFQKHFGQVQLVLGSSLDVDELRFYEFHVDMALDIEGQAPV